VNSPLSTAASPITQTSVPTLEVAGSLQQAEHHALTISELLNVILRHTDASTLYAAWNVSRRWRASFKYVLTGKQHSPASWTVASGETVGYGQRLDSTLVRRHPTDEELSIFEGKLSRIEEYESTLFDSSSLPASLTQRYEWSSQARQMLNAHEDGLEMFFNVQPPKSRRPHCFWLDFTQFDTNPNLETLFKERFTIH
jgi:hypothetical protein